MKNTLFYILILFLFSCKAQLHYPKMPQDLNNKEHHLGGPVTLQDDHVVTMSSQYKDMIALHMDKEPEYIPKSRKEKMSSVPKITESDLGQIVYKIPDTMQVRKTYQISVRIAKGTDDIKIVEEYRGKVTTRIIKTSSIMEVLLVDPAPDDRKSFEITKINNDIQMIDSTGYTEWLFSITPIHTGKYKLNLIVSIIRNDSRKQIVYTDKIYVRSNASAQIQTFWEKNWNWTFDTILIPLITFAFGIWFANRRKKRKS